MHRLPALATFKMIARNIRKEAEPRGPLWDPNKHGGCALSGGTATKQPNQIIDTHSKPLQPACKLPTAAGQPPKLTTLTSAPLLL